MMWNFRSKVNDCISWLSSDRSPSNIGSLLVSKINEAQVFIGTFYAGYETAADMLASSISLPIASSSWEYDPAPFSP